MRTSRSLLIAALVVIVLTVASVPLLNAVVYTPARAAEAYVAAIGRGDAERAFSYLSSPTPTSTLALSSEVLSAAPDLPRDAEARTISTDGDSATVSLSYVLGSRPETVELTMVRLPPAAGLFHRWAIEQEAWPTLGLEVSGSSTATVNGYSVAAGEVPVLFPATYLVGFDGTYLRSQSERVEIGAPGATPTVSLAPEPTKQLQEAVSEQVDEHMHRCVEATTLQPAGCVFGYDTDNEILGDVTWSLEREPTVALEAEGNDLELTPTTVELRVQGRYRDIVTAAEHDFDEKLSFVLSGSVVVRSSEVRFEPRRLGDVTVL
ncbi:hypothetical protein DFO66_102147 [Brevibacterium sanguinis]|uniref:Uncharacterized protein n=2 Tax=Brevibacterium TaxID=1696 RepID=A0A366INZ8_9MICO|nr:MULTISPECIES: hypothetical protein [Brevibacterium]RBP67094.1 hypothetical protein DFO66_102147 [Brevibacterium sanguinis]RBP73619.1 hypothetical protein DFO65_102147 [Brevibacterium celere]